jgi:hypothetical protein
MSLFRIKIDITAFVGISVVRKMFKEEGIPEPHNAVVIGHAA